MPDQPTIPDRPLSWAITDDPAFERVTKLDYHGVPYETVVHKPGRSTKDLWGVFRQREWSGGHGLTMDAEKQEVLITIENNHGQINIP